MQHIFFPVFMLLALQKIASSFSMERRRVGLLGGDVGKRITKMTSENLSGYSSSASSKTCEPLFRFGIISDIQYADVEDGAGFSGRPRYYRRALEQTQQAADHWKEAGAAFGVHLGDVLDIHCPPEDAGPALARVAEAFGRFPGRTHHLVGNHCLYNCDRDQLRAALGWEPCPEPDCSYYAFEHEGFVFISLDGYDIAMTGRKPDDFKYQAAEAILTAANPNRDNLNSPDGLRGLDRRFVMFGGGIGFKQAAWFRGQLAAARAAGKRAVVFCHQPLHPASDRLGVCMLWNYEELLNILQQHSDVVVATFTGHAHRGLYSIDHMGIHHKVMEAVVECPPGSAAFGLVEVHADRLVLRGRGLVGDREMEFDFLRRHGARAAAARAEFEQEWAQGARATEQQEVEEDEEQEHDNEEEEVVLGGWGAGAARYFQEQGIEPPPEVLAAVKEGLEDNQQQQSDYLY
ncbi:unnamed protein product [Heterosigma akashiwo]|uniref:Uncharacterized protein n=1 Tax=Heterosigma akashiwo TaxID=2829 RepID=A0A6S9IZ31_HETAK|mmetsp:Transcript_26071/g.41040  ORF Transcript_26071/g.41040 Transcript_26071/m.41040 type:complete len:460 (-) Transcript_26071:49-1428(-)